MRIPELLVPVGGKEQLKAAVANGADAVYMSGSTFNARLNADNFKDDELSEAIDFAHEYGVRVHITQNTLIRTDEMPSAIENAVKMYELGADALIIQDRGLASILKKILPDMPLHMSTQGTVYDIDGVKEAVRAGFDRVILSRELSGSEIAAICRQNDTEIEVFVHGAICICYSGQCHMSEFIGGRSGNRGACAQPCRLPYDIARDGKILGSAAPYPLSPSDMNLLGHLRELAEAGVASLKIEGRMKSPEYVAIVASEYRKCLDALKYQNEAGGGFEKLKNSNAESERRLRQIFSRGEFTDAYFRGESGKSLMSDELPKHHGIKIGEIAEIDRKRGHAVIKLTGNLSNGDGIEIRTSGKTTYAAGGIITYIKEANLGRGRDLSANSGVKNKKDRNNKNGGNGSNGGNNKKRNGAGSAAAGALLKTASKGLVVEAGDLPSLLKYPENTFAVGTPVYKISDAALNADARSTYEKMPQRIGVKFSFMAKTGEQASLTACAVNKTDGSIFEHTVYSENILEKANNRPADEESVTRQLKKTGGTAYYAEECLVETEGGPMVPASELNAMRRDVLNMITESFTAKRRVPENRAFDAVSVFTGKNGHAEYGCGAGTGETELITINIQPTDNSTENAVNRVLEFITAADGLKGTAAAEKIRLNVPYRAALSEQLIKASEDVGIKITACMPVITKPDNEGKRTVEESTVNQLRSLCAEGKLYGVSVANASQLMYFRNNEEGAFNGTFNESGTEKTAGIDYGSGINDVDDDIRIFFEESMNLYNSYAVSAAHACGMSCGVASHELRPDDIIASFAGQPSAQTDSSAAFADKTAPTDPPSGASSKGPALPISTAGAASCCEVSVWGRVPLMHLEHCPVGTAYPRGADSPFNGVAAQRSASGFCSAKNKKHYCRAGNHSLRDRKGELFSLVPDERTCRCTVMSHRPVDFTDRIADLSRAGIKNFRFNVFDESAEEIINMIVHLFG